MVYAPTKHKPMPWAPISRGLIVPRYQGLWRGLMAANWMNFGAKAFDLTKNPHVLTYTNTTMEPSPWGIGAKIDAAGEVLYYAGSGDTVITVKLDSTAELSFVLVIYITAFTGANPGIWRTGATSRGTSFFIVDGTDTSLWLRINDTDIFGSGNSDPTISTGLNVLGFSFRNSDKAIGVRNGIVDFSVAHAATLPTQYIHRLGYHFDTGQRLDGIYLATYFWDRYLEIGEHKDLFEDPFAPFRMAEEWAFKAPVVAGWTGEIIGVTNPSEVIGIAVANIDEVIGI